MVRTCFVPSRHFCRWQLGQVLSLIRLHRVEFDPVNGTPVVRKRRRWFSRFLIPVGNLFLKITSSQIVVLSSTRWLEWERAVEISTRRDLVFPTNAIACPAQLQCRRIPGVSLTQVLNDRHYSPQQKLDAVRWSVDSLRRLHQHVADWGDGIRQSITHGDATANNVVVDVDNYTAIWIDFDTRHRTDLSEVDRRTDDLRSLIYSVAVYLPADSYSDIAGILADAQFDDEVVLRFQLRLRSDWMYMTTTQLTQAPLPWSSARALRAALLDALTAITAKTPSPLTED